MEAKNYMVEYGKLSSRLSYCCARFFLLSVLDVTKVFSVQSRYRILVALQQAPVMMICLVLIPKLLNASGVQHVLVNAFGRNVGHVFGTLYDSKARDTSTRNILTGHKLDMLSHINVAPAHCLHIACLLFHFLALEHQP